MKRVLAFFVFGPALAAVTALVMAQADGQQQYDIDKILAVAAFFLTLPVSAIIVCVDAVLHDVPIPLRATLTATVGAVVSFGLAFILFGWSSPPRYLFTLLAIGGATCMGVCSLVANDWRRSPVPAGV